MLYEKDNFGNIITYDSNQKAIKRNEKGYIIEYDRWGTQVLRN